MPTRRDSRTGWRLVPLVALGVGAGLGVSAAQQSGQVVIRPRAESGAAPTLGAPGTPVIPDRPGWVVIRPRLPGQPPSTPPTLLSSAGKSSPTVPVAPSLPRLPAGPLPKLGTLLVAAPQEPAVKANPAAPVGDEGRVLVDAWDVVFVRGLKAGHFHTTVREYVREGQTLAYGVKRANLKVARFGQPAEMWSEESSLETATGQVLTTRLAQGLGKNQMLALEGVVKDGSLNVTISGATSGTRSTPFPAEAVGVAQEARMFAARKPKVGDTFSYQGYLPIVNRVATYTVTVQGEEALTVYEGQPPRKALKLEMKTERIGKYRHPAATVYLDAASFEPIKLETFLPILGGQITVLRTSQDYATRPSTKLPELNEHQSIVLDRPLPNVHQLSSVTYRVGVTELDAEDAFVADTRQKLVVSPVDPQSFDLVVTAQRMPLGSVPAGAPAAKVAEEFTASSTFIDWQNDLTRAQAAEAVRALPPGAGAWQKAQAVERWVHSRMKPAEFSQTMASCSETSRTLGGDCTEYAMLAAGMCRAVGVPSRTALGLVYAPDRQGRGTLAYHMWFEVLVDAEWLALDATLGLGGVGPGHLKITEASWFQQQDFGPLLPVMTLLQSRPSVTVISAR